MVDQDLRSAANELAGEFEGLDPVSIVTTGLGIGTGLFAAEFVAEIVGNTFAPEPGRRRIAIEVASKLGLAGVHVFARRFVGGQFVGVMLILAAAGATASAVLQVVETFIASVQTGSAEGSAPHGGNVERNVSADAGTSSGASGGQIQGETLAAT